MAKSKSQIKAMAKPFNTKKQAFAQNTIIVMLGTVLAISIVVRLYHYLHYETNLKKNVR